jgi:hypothetical protein
MSFRHRFLTRQILAAMGTSITALATMTACTSTVVVEGGSGGAGTSSSSAGTGGNPVVGSSSSSGGTTFICDEPFEGSLEYACIEPNANGSCPSPVEAQGALDNQLSGECPTSDPDFCGCWEYVGDVPCGPDPTVDDACCYYVQMYKDEVCEGRPFQVAGQARVALAMQRDDWSQACCPQLDDLDARTRRALADAWREDGLFEHASIASFARFVMELMAVGAPADMVADAQAALSDEIRHARICFGLSQAYGGMPVGPGPLAIDGGLSERHDLTSIAVATAVEGCINETLATLVAHDAAAAATDPVAKQALQSIADDESRHAALAWRFVAWACERDARTAAAVAEAFRRARPADAGAPLPQGVDRAALRAHGQLPRAERADVLSRGFDEVVMTCARAMLTPTKQQVPRSPLRAAGAA